MKTTTERLILALSIIKLKYPDKQVIAIEFEDGSGNRFNYKINTASGWQYIDLENLLNTISKY